MTHAVEADLMAMLDRLRIETTRHAHPPLHSVEESRALRGDMPGGHSKNLFLKDKKGDFTLVSCLEDRAVRIKDVARAAGARPPSFAKPEDLWDRLGVRPGSVTPFALMNDADRAVRLVLDQGLLAHDVVNFHPLHNEATLAISPADLMRFFTATGHDPVILDFDALETGV